MHHFRAFISHSSHDKDFVDMIFDHLDRASVIYDRYEFDDGAVLTDKIAARIADCGIFVLLGSKAALASKWVKLEAHVAQSLREAGLMNDVLLFALADATHRDFPDWLVGLSITKALNPMHVSSAIQDKQLEVIERVQNPVFLNRHEEIAKAEDYLQGIRAEGSSARKILAFFGSAGFGRHSLARLVFRNVCGLSKRFVLRFQSGDDFRDLIIKLAQHASKYETFEQLKVAIDEIRLSTEEQLTKKANVFLAQLVSTNTLLVIEDEGGLLDADGFFYAASLALLSAVEKTPGLYAAIITRRKPHSRSGLAIPGIAVGDLQPSVAGALVAKYAEAAGMRINAEADLLKVAARVGGHPAALKYAIELAVDYGLDAVLADDAFLTENNIERYWQEIKIDGTLRELHRAVLAALAIYETATLSILAALLNVDPATVADAVRHLVELVLVTVDRAGQYHLCSALLDVVPRLFPETSVNHDRGYHAFTEYLARNPDVENRLSLERSRGVAATLGHSNVAPDRVLMLAADYVRLADEAYRGEKFKRAFEFAALALKMRPGNFVAVKIFIQSGAKRRCFTEASACLEENVANLQSHEVEYFNGMIERGMGHYEPALRHYKRSLDLGRRGLAIHRELSLCFYKLGFISDAENHLRQAFREVYGANNPYLLDLGIRIAISKHEETKARSYLADSKLYDKPHHASILEAAVELAFGSPSKAVGCLAAVGKRVPYFAKYLMVVAHLRLNELLFAQKAIQDLAKWADPVDARLLQAALLWSREKREEAIAEIARDDATADDLKYRELREFIVGNDGVTDDGRVRLTRILINQGARSSKT